MRRRCCCKSTGTCHIDFHWLQTSKFGFTFTPTGTPSSASAYWVKFQWNFGDDSTQTETIPTSVPHTYDRVGTYNVTLVATDSTGAVCSAEHTVYVSDVVALFQMECLAGHCFNFINLSYLPVGSPLPNITRVVLDWGDGTNLLLAGFSSDAPDHCYNPGTYTVCLTIYGTIAGRPEEILSQYCTTISVSPNLVCCCGVLWRNRWAWQFSRIPSPSNGNGACNPAVCDSIYQVHEGNEIITCSPGGDPFTMDGAFGFGPSISIECGAFGYLVFAPSTSCKVLSTTDFSTGKKIAIGRSVGARVDIRYSAGGQNHEIIGTYSGLLPIASVYDFPFRLTRNGSAFPPGWIGNNCMNNGIPDAIDVWPI